MLRGSKGGKAEHGNIRWTVGLRILWEFATPR